MTIGINAPEWLATSGDGSFAMGTAAGERTRRYHGLLIAPAPLGRERRLGLVELRPLLHGARLEAFEIVDGIPRWRWRAGGILLQRELALLPGRGVVGVVDELLAAPGPVEVVWQVVATWRPAGGSREGSPALARLIGDRLSVDDLLHLRWEAAARPVRDRAPVVRYNYPEEAARGYEADEELPVVATLSAHLAPGEAAGFVAWVGDEPGITAAEVIDSARHRTRALTTSATDAADALLRHAADQFVVTTPEVDVIAGFPWFGAWSRDTLTAYDGLFLSTGRLAEGANLLERLAATLSEGMLANTADFGGLAYNTVDAAMWFLHAAERHLAVTSDLGLGRRLLPGLVSIVDHHLAGTRYGIRVTPDGLVTQGSPGTALTWMDARVSGRPITQRAGKPVEVNGLWVAGLGFLATLHTRLGEPAHHLEALHARAAASFVRRFPRPDGGLADVLDGPAGDDTSLRPNQLIAAGTASVPGLDAAAIARDCAPLVTPLGLRSLGPAEPGYAGRYAGPMPERDAVYHQGTVWPWLIGPYVDTLRRAGLPTDGVLDGLEAHLATAGLGSVSEVADGDAPHAPSGCPFQAWSVAELLRVRRELHASGTA